MKSSSRLRALTAVALCSVPPAVAVSCSSSDSSPPPVAPQPDASVDTQPLPDTSTPPDVVQEFVLVDLVSWDHTTTCADGDACGDGGVCAGGVCCAAELACHSSCCESSQVCSFGKCVVPGLVCHESTDCSATEYCEYALGGQGDAGPTDAGPDTKPDGAACTSGVVYQEGRCLPKPPACADVDGGTGDGGSTECLATCEYHATDFTLEVKYAWGGEITAPWSTDVMMTPVVIELDDDDCDGKVTTNDIPEIVFTSFSNGKTDVAGTVHAISILNGEVVEKWTAPDGNPVTQIAAGNIDGFGGNEVVYCTMDGRVRALAGDGTEVWTSNALKCFSPAIADFDRNGTPEVVVEGGILDGATGFLKTVFTPAMEGTFVLSDIDDDGVLDVVANSAAWHSDGAQFANTKITGHSNPTALFLSGPAVADLDKDGKPEVVAINFMLHRLFVWRYDASTPDKVSFVRQDVDINGALPTSLCSSSSAGSQRGGGPVTIGEFNGDGVPDIALAGGVGYVVFDGKKVMNPAIANSQTILWIKQTSDCSSAGTGSSLFDFNGDGPAEVVYGDESYLRMYKGSSGIVLHQICNTNSTLNEYPVIADVDNDGEADIVVSANAYNQKLICEGKRQSGVRVLSSASHSFVRTRRIWNQHSYHITNVEEDGRIPQNELPNWTQPGLNNFRLNKQPGNEASAPDAVVSMLPGCALAGLTAVVRNLGEASLPAGAKVKFFIGLPANNVLLTEAVTTKSLLPMQAEKVHAPLPNPPSEIMSGKKQVFAKVEVSATTHECRSDNNESDGVKVGCSAPR